MKRYKPHNRICLQNKKNIHSNFNILKLKKKKWFFFKRNLRFLKKNKIIKKPEKKKELFRERLFAKQQFKFFYGCIAEYQLKNLFKLSLKKTLIQRKNILKNFICLLESRLDIILFRSNLATSIFHAQQLISHQKIIVNKIIITSNYYFLKEGDIFFLKEDSIIKRKKKPLYIEYNNKLKKFIFLRKPFFNEIYYPFLIDLKLVLEFLKK